MKNPRPWLVKRARVLVVLCGLGLLLPLLTHALADVEGRVAWLVDLAAHWQWLYVIGLVPAVVIVALGDRRWWCALLLVPLPWLTAAPAAPQNAHAAASFVIASANVHLDNVDVQPLADWLAQTRPDAVVVLEVSPRYAEGLRTLSDYPHQHVVAANDPFGIAVLSRHPMQAQAVRGDGSEPVRIEAMLQTPSTCVALIGVHPMPPIAAEFHRTRNSLLRVLAADATNRAQPTIIAGDLNATPWSSAFVGLADAGLHRASDLQPSWPSVGRGLVGIAIDHVLVSAQWTVAHSERGDAIGSDHLPLLARLHLADSGDANLVKCPRS